MQTWARLAKIKKIDYKNKGLLVSPINDPCFIVGKTLYIVPPALEGPRSIKVKEVKNNKLIIPEGDFEVQGEYLLIDELPQEEAKQVFDKKLGLLGELKYIDSSSAQEKLVVDYKGKEILIPNVEEIVEIKDDIYVDLPEGLLDL